MLSELKQKTIKGVKWTSIATAFGAIIQVAQLAILARFLKPFEFGLIGIINVVIGFSQAFMDMGISNGIIHYQKITKEELSSLYWLNVISGIAIFAILSIISQYIGNFFKAEQLPMLLILVSTTFIIIPFGQQFQILLQKDLRFKYISGVEIITKLVGFIILIILLLLGWKIYSLVWSLIISTILSTALYILFGIKEHNLAFVFKFNKIRRFVNFGIFQMMEKTINYFNLQIDSLLIGKLLGLAALGVYTLPKNLVLRPIFLINPIITRVTFPMMSKMQDDIITLKNTYLKTINYLSSVTFPFYIFLAFFAEPVILILFGKGWESSVVILRILAIWAAIRSTGNPIGSLALARGRADLGFYWNLALFSFIPIAIFIGNKWGIIGVSVALLLVQTCLVIPNWWFLVKKLCGARFVEYFEQMSAPFIIATLSCLLGYLLTFRVIDSLLKLTLGLLIVVVIYILISMKLNNSFIKILKNLFFREK